MIVTVTLSPAVDKTARIEKIIDGGLNRLEEITVDADGKGINVSKMVAVLGGASVATGFLGLNAYSDITGALDALGIKTDFAIIKGRTRTNLKILRGGAEATEFGEPDPEVRVSEVSSLVEKLKGHAKPGVSFAFSGSLPVGMTPDMYLNMLNAVKDKGAAVFIDADGEAFSAALKAKPDYVKPNRSELAQHFGVGEDFGLDQAASLCRRLVNAGVKTVALSMGEKGALFVTKHENLYAHGLEVGAKSTAGAGDSMVGAILHASSLGLTLKETAALAIAASTGAITAGGATPPTREIVVGLLNKVEFENVT